MTKLIGTLFFFGCAFGVSAKPVSHLSIAPVPPVVIAPGGKGDLTLQLKVAPGFHIQANPATLPGLIATKVDLATMPPYQAGKPLFPKPKPYKVKGLSVSIDTFEGELSIRVPLTVLAGAAAGKTSLSGKIRYQACDASLCFPPQFENFVVPVEVRP